MKNFNLFIVISCLLFLGPVMAEPPESSVAFFDGDTMNEPSRFATPVMHGMASYYSMGTPGLMLGKLFPPSMIMHNQERLGLSEKQVEAIKKEMRQFQSGIVDVQWDLHGATGALRKELDKTDIDMERALTLVDRVLAAENKMKKSHLTLLIKIRNVLDESQINKMKRNMPFSVGAVNISAGSDFIWNGSVDSF